MGVSVWMKGVRSSVVSVRVFKIGEYGRPLKRQYLGVIAAILVYISVYTVKWNIFSVILVSFYWPTMAGKGYQQLWNKSLIPDKIYLLTKCNKTILFLHRLFIFNNQKFTDNL